MARTHIDKFVTMYDSAKKYLMIIDNLYLSFQRDIEAISNVGRAEKTEKECIELSYISSSLIDYIFRFHQVIDAMPLLNKSFNKKKKLDEVLALKEKDIMEI